jgi:L-asparaginase
MARRGPKNRGEPRPRVLILFCGGTIIMKEDSRGALRVGSRSEAIQILREIEPKLNTIADFDIEYVDNIDSTNMTPSKWDAMLHVIKKNYARYDGFLVTHGTDTMAYTAGALSIGIRNLGKPVVLTGSQIPGSRLGTDARRNLVNSMRLAIANVSGVYLLFHNRIILGSRATKSSESRLDAFSSVNRPDAGEVKIDIRLSRDLPERRPGDIEIMPGFEQDIFVFNLTPGCDPRDLEFLLDNDRVRGIIVQAYGTGNMPYKFDMFFQLARKKRIPVIVTSQCLQGMTMMNGYDVGSKALNLGAIEGYDQSLEMLTVKLMWALRRYDYGEIKNVMHTDYAGELDTSYLAERKR